MSVSPEEPRPAIVDALAAALCANDECEDRDYGNDFQASFLADAVLSLPVVSRALQITREVDRRAADMDVDYPEGRGLTDVGLAVAAELRSLSRLRAVGVVDPKPASSDDRNRASRASVDTQP